MTQCFHPQYHRSAGQAKPRCNPRPRQLEQSTASESRPGFPPTGFFLLIRHFRPPVKICRPNPRAKVNNAELGAQPLPYLRHGRSDRSMLLLHSMLRIRMLEMAWAFTATYYSRNSLPRVFEFMISIDYES